MRWVLPLALLLVTSTAFAQKKKTAKEEAPPDNKGGMMEESGKDPAETETAEDSGEFTPGKHKQKKGAAAGSGEIGAGIEGEEGSKEGAAAEDEPKPKKPRTPKKTIGVFGEVLIGFGEVPMTGATTTGDVTSYGFLLGGHYDLSKDFRLMLRVPWTTASFDAGGETKSAAALGNPEFLARMRLTQPGDSEFAARLGIGIPVAQGNADEGNPSLGNASNASGREQAIVNLSANAAAGYHDPELYTPKYMPITPALLYTYRADRLRLGAELKLVVMPKTGGSVKNPSGATGTYELKSVAFIPVSTVTVSYQIVSQVHLALAAWGLYRFIKPLEYDSKATEPSRFQMVFEPRVFAQFGRVVPSVGFLIPAGGELGGKMNAVRLHVDVVF